MVRKAAGSATPTKPSPSAARLVWGVWGFLLLSAIFYVNYFGINTPYFDEWIDTVPFWTGERALNGGNLWDYHANHRIPIQRLVLLGLLEITGGDFRSGMYANVLLQAAMAAGFLVLLRRLHPPLRPTDTLLPIFLMGGAHAFVYLTPFQLAFTLSSGLLVLFYCCALLYGIHRATKWLLPLVTSLLLLPFCGFQGVIAAVPLALWLLDATLSKRDGETVPAGHRAIGGFSAAATLLLCVLHGISGKKTHGLVQADSLGKWLHQTLDFVLTGFGFSGLTASIHPVVNLAALLTALLLLALVIAVTIRLLLLVRSQPAMRNDALLTLAIFGSTAVLALAVGLGRTQGGYPRYITLTAPFLAILYITLRRLDRDRLKQWGMIALAVLGGMALLLNIPRSWRTGAYQAGSKRAFLRDIQAGRAISLVAYRHVLGMETEFKFLYEGLASLKRRGVAPYTQLTADPVIRKVTLSLSAFENVTAESTAGGTLFTPSNGQPILAHRLDTPRRVFAIRLRYRYDARPAHGPACYYTVGWRESGAKGFYFGFDGILKGKDSDYPGIREETLFIDSTVEELRITGFGLEPNGLTINPRLLPTPLLIESVEIWEVANSR